MNSLGPKFAVLEERDPSQPHNELEELYGRCMKWGEGRASLAVNFVVSVDGATTFSEGDSKEIGMNSAEDRLLMAMLRASASSVVVGASTLRASSTHQWTAKALAAPDQLDALTELRVHVTGSEKPAPLLVVSASGELPEDHVALRAPETDTYVLTTSRGSNNLSRFENVKVIVSSAEQLVPAAEIVEVANSLGSGLILCEGGPHLFGQLLEGHLVDQLFLTISPQIVGGEGHRLIEGFSSDPGTAAHSDLVSVRSAGNHLFLRYRF